MLQNSKIFNSVDRLKLNTKTVEGKKKKKDGLKKISKYVHVVIIKMPNIEYILQYNTKTCKKQTIEIN